MPTPPPPSRTAERVERAFVAPQGPARWLIVDDVPAVRERFRRLTAKARLGGAEVAFAASGPEALEWIRREKFDVVVSDYRLGGTDGIEILRMARAAHPSGRRILMTAYNEIPVDIARIRDARVDAYLTKPMDEQDLLLALWAFFRGDEAGIASHRSHARELEQAADMETGPAGCPS